MGSKELVLGIDVGTTSVKACILNPKENKIEALQAKDTQANVPSELGCEGNKQNPPKIMSALHFCVSRLPKPLLKRVVKIGVCGQMHGVVLWHHSQEGGAPWELNDSSRYDIKPQEVSSLYTWQDSRCDPPFLATLPKPQSHLQAYSGYGCNTLFWFSRNRVDKLERFNCAGTIEDFAVAMLCNLEKPVMSVQNAASWGYFDTDKVEWNLEVLESAGFPIQLLPKVIASGEVAGHLVDDWHGIPAGTPVGAALGDMQCSVLSALHCHNPDDAVMNISTSAQLAFIAPSFDPSVDECPTGFHKIDKSFHHHARCQEFLRIRVQGDQNNFVALGALQLRLRHKKKDENSTVEQRPRDSSPFGEQVTEETKVEFLPYFEGKYLAVAAALNGGNVLAAFVAMLQQWTLDLGCSLPQSKVWERVIALASNTQAESSLQVVPTLLGERHVPQQNASVHNIDLGNLGLGKVFKATCKGIVENLHSIMPREMLVSNDIARIIGIGSALKRNKALQEEVERCYQLPVIFETSCGAAWGAAIAASRMT